MTDDMESLIFNNETTYRSDYRYGEIIHSVKTTSRPKNISESPKATKLKNIHTLTEWPSVPFDLFIKQKDIVRTDPRQIQQECTEPPDLDREGVQKTRPRLTIAPAVNIDDVDEQETRQILVTDTYSSTTQKVLQEGVPLAAHEKKAPVLELPSLANPIVLPKLRAPYVSPEWRPDTVTWDRRQLRAHCDPSKEFFLAMEPKCSASEVSTASSKQRK